MLIARLGAQSAQAIPHAQHVYQILSSQVAYACQIVQATA